LFFQISHRFHWLTQIRSLISGKGRIHESPCCILASVFCVLPFQIGFVFSD
jgi:hypothetical protein